MPSIVPPETGSRLTTAAGHRSGRRLRGPVAHARLWSATWYLKLFLALNVEARHFRNQERLFQRAQIGVDRLWINPKALSKSAT
jgi:hypothetical protein